MKKILIGIIAISVGMSSCKLDSTVQPEIIIDPIPYQVTRDSVETGSYLGINIDENAADAYSKIQALQSLKGVTFLNIVSNTYSDLGQLQERLPLYQYILLDQKQGTDSGVQITIEGQTVKAIYLNSGTKLNQWPTNSKEKSSVRMGDHVSVLYQKLVNIRQLNSYSNKFERISLLTKNLATPYDLGMTRSPQWYFTYPTGPKQMDEIQLHFKEGKVHKIYINHYR